MAEENPRKEIFLKKLPRKIGWQYSFDIMMVYLNEKPGALVMDPNFGEIRTLKKSTSKLNLKYHYTDEESIKQFIKQTLFSDTMETGGFFIYKNKDSLSKLEKSEDDGFYGFTEKSVGIFLGYPKESAEYYVETNQMTNLVKEETEEKLKKLLKNEELSKEEVEYLKYVSYIPKPSEKEIKKAIEIGKNYSEALDEFDSELGKIYSKKLSTGFYIE